MVTTTGNSGSAEDTTFTYYDSILGVTFSFDPFTYPFTLEGTIVSEEPMQVPTSPFKEQLVQGLSAYLKSSYAEKKALFAVNQQGESEGHQVIEISCQNIKLESMWAGEWLSTWTLQNGQLSGSIKVKTHYFEMGNMQMSLDKEFDSIALKNAADTKDVIAAIKKTEDKVSNFFKLNSLINFNKIVVPRRFGGDVQEHPGQPFEKNEKSCASNFQEVRLGRPCWNNKMNNYE
jgi:hypothetical protein|tara:strand:- start:259 stop:954 length:696 start_codon:yes stop_codon:yes gene_type:complete